MLFRYLEQLVSKDRRLLFDKEAPLLNSCAESERYFLKPLVIVAKETGMRRGKLLNLIWDGVASVIKSQENSQMR